MLRCVTRGAATRVQVALRHRAHLHLCRAAPDKSEDKARAQAEEAASREIGSHVNELFRITTAQPAAKPAAAAAAASAVDRQLPASPPVEGLASLRPGDIFVPEDRVEQARTSSGDVADVNAIKRMLQRRTQEPGLTVQEAAASTGLRPEAVERLWKWVAFPRIELVDGKGPCAHWPDGRDAQRELAFVARLKEERDRREAAQRAIAASGRV